jgi:hypothetical protein
VLSRAFQLASRESMSFNVNKSDLTIPLSVFAASESTTPVFMISLCFTYHFLSVEILSLGVLDLFFIFIATLFFVACWAFTRACDRL